MEKAFIERTIHGKTADKRSHAKLVETDDESRDDNTEPVEGRGPGKTFPEGKEHIIDKIPHRLYPEPPLG